MGSIGPAELIVVLVIALLVFGPKKLPEIGRGIGSAIREFKRASRDLMSYIDAPEPEPPRVHPETVPTSRPSAVDEPAPVLPPADPGPTNQPAR